MRAIIRLLSLSFLLFAGCQNHAKEIKIMSFNIRYDNPGDGANAWPNRTQIMKEFLISESPDIIGFQEALHHQVKGLETMLPGYDWVGSGRTDGKQEGEYTPIFFKISAFELETHGQFWLSETPDVIGSIGPGAVLPRIATWAKLIQKSSGDTLFVFNTHYSHVSDDARRLGAEIMADRMRQIAEMAPLILTGDFNIEYHSEMYEKVSQHFLEINQLSNTLEFRELAPSSLPDTYNGFSANNPGSLIDYIFVNDQIKVTDYQVRKITVGEIFISDHWPVIVKVKIGK